MNGDAGYRMPQGAKAGEGTPRVAYRHIRRNLTRSLTGRPEAARTQVPACPGWTVHDAVAHLVDSCRLAERNLAGPPPHHVAEGLPALLAEWNRSGARVDRGLRETAGSSAGSVLVMDAYTHEVDVRHALGLPVPVAHPAFPIAFELAVDGFRAAVTMRGCPALRLETKDGAWHVGDGAPYAIVFGTGHDLYRSLVGRRTVQQIRELAWTADPEAWLPAFGWGLFRPPLAPVE
ncbi:maleylpyruvate isomerase family mycothiol-dependent enzyme [Streptomyces sp. G5(2025)]|uniref:maleylpyruvate isomerase family mycothiol-dependent enzyme n=1 Tax=Streptomyces sp. G5(2025) TaxID=3406628 RepID=UPI003C1E0590